MNRAYTEEEVIGKLMEYVDAIVHDVLSVENKTEEEKIRLALFSLFSTLDGSAIDLPAFKVIPSPHPDDKDYHAARGEEWYPDNIDIAGNLHGMFANFNNVKEDPDCPNWGGTCCGGKCEYPNE